MKISCQSCQAKYAIADEKVTGKVVKIRCKKCGTTLVVDGRPGGGATPSTEPESVWMVHLVAQSSAEGSASEEGEQVELTLRELIAAYRQGRIDDTTYCWKEGMADWLPLVEIAELTAAVHDSGAELSDAGVSVAAAETLPWPPGSMPAPPTEVPSWRYTPDAADAPAAATALASPFADAPPAALFQNPSEMTGHSSRPSRPSYPHFPDNALGAHPPPSSRPSGPPSGSMRFGVDGAAVEVPMSDEVEPHAGSANSPPARAGHPNTLLGPPSSDMLSRLSGPPSDPSPFALALAGHGDVKMTGERGEASVLFSLAAVKGEAPPPRPSEPVMGENSGMIDMRALMDARAQHVSAAPPPGGRVDDIMNLSPGGMLAGSLSPPVLSTATAAPAGTADDALTGGGARLNTPLVAGASVLVVGIIAAVVTGAYALRQEQPTPAASVPTATPTVTIPPASATAPSATASVQAPPAPKFNVEAAKAELSKIAATLGTCKKAGGPTGSGKILLTFSNDGKVEAANLDGAPFAKTAVGECVLARFSEAKVPAFGGGTQPTAKTFTIK